MTADETEQSETNTENCLALPSNRAGRFDFIQKLTFFPDNVERAVAGDPVGALSTVYLDLNTDICNHSCHFCDGYHRPITAEAFTAERLMKLVDEFQEVGVHAVVIAGDRGEPLMHPAAPEVISGLAAAGISVGIYTNGTALSTRLRQTLGAVSWLRVSADAATAATHRAMHRYPSTRDDFSRMLTNIGWYSTRIQDVGCSFIIDPLNSHEIELAADVLLRAGARFIEYRPKYLPKYQVDTPWLLANRLSLTGALEAAQAKWGERVIITPQMNSLLHNEELPTLNVASRLCRTSLLRMVISTHGCYPCTPYRGNAEHSFGDIRKQTLREVLESVHRRKMLDETCTLRCAYHAQNDFLLDIRDGRAELPTPGNAMTIQDSFI